MHSSSKEKTQIDRAALGGFPSKENGGFVFYIMHSSRKKKHDRAAFGGFRSLLYHAFPKEKKHDRATFGGFHPKTKFRMLVFCIMLSSSKEKHKLIEPLLEGSLQKQNLAGTPSVYLAGAENQKKMKKTQGMRNAE